MSRILVTGASRGIGRAIACRLAAPGQHLLLHGRNQPLLSETAELVRKGGGEPTVFAHDLGTPEGILNLVNSIGELQIDGLIHNAAVAFVKPFEELTITEWQQSLAVNVTAPFLLTQKLLPRLVPGATIVHVLSPAAKTGFPGWSAYCMSKFALEGFSQSLREELRPRAIRVVNVYPAATDTDIWGSVDGIWPRDKMLAASEVADAVAYAISRPAKVVIENLHVATLAGRI